jgi:hypothetical protein
LQPVEPQIQPRYREPECAFQHHYD